MHKINHFSNKNQCQNTQCLNIMKFIILSIFITITGFFLIGCSGSGNSGENVTSASSEPIEGVFIDSPVEGLNYRTETTSGITDENGRFFYYPDEIITFMIGDVVLGQVTADKIITPMDFLDTSDQPHDVTHPMVTNMGRFLQSLDADGDPDNGITITDEVRDEVSGRMIDFNQSINDFENDPDVIACFDVFNGLNMPRDNAMMWGLKSAEEAQQHMIAYMDEYMPGYMNNQMNSDDADSDIDHPMDEYMGEEMFEYMDDHMNFGGTGAGDEISHPMDGYMNDHMAFDDTDEDGNVDHPMDEYMGEGMFEYMNDHMNFEGTDGDDDIDHPMGGGTMGNHMGM